MGKGAGDGGGGKCYRVSSARRHPYPPPPVQYGGNVTSTTVFTTRGHSYPPVPCTPRVQFGGNVTSTTDATDGSQFPLDSSASQSQKPAGSSLLVEEVPRLPDQDTELAKSGLPTPDSVLVKEVPRLTGEATELAAKSVVLTPDSVVVEEIPKFPGQSKELATSGVPNPDSEALGCLNEGSEKALDVQSLEALLHGYGREDPERAAEDFRGVMLAFIAVFLQWARSHDYNFRRELCQYILPNGEKAGRSSSKGNLVESSDAPNAKRTRPVDPNLAGSKNSTGVRQRGKSFGSQIRLPGTREKIWLGTYKTEKAAAQARDAAAKWLETHPGTEFLDHEGRNELKNCAKEAGKHLSDDRSHHNVALPDCVENVGVEASLKGKAVASAEHVIQWESLPQENPFSSSEFEEKATKFESLKRKAVASAEHVSQWESPAQENPLSPSKFEEKATTLGSLKGNAVASPEHVSQWEFPAHENFSPELDLSVSGNSFPESDMNFWDNFFVSEDNL